MSTPSTTSFLRIWQIVGDKKRGVPAMFPMSAPTVWRLARQGKFPKPYILTPGVTAWAYDDVIAWANSRQQRQST